MTRTVLFYEVRDVTRSGARRIAYWRRGYGYIPDNPFRFFAACVKHKLSLGNVGGGVSSAQHADNQNMFHGRLGKLLCQQLPTNYFQKSYVVFYSVYVSVQTFT